MTRIIVTGATGQVGWELARALRPLGEVILPGRDVLNLAEPGTVREAVLALRPNILVNAAAYTAVDKAESEPELAHRINAHSPGEMALACKANGALLVHYSTDYVFDGRKTTPYTETDETNPQSVYGHSKLGGEQAIRSVGGRHLILRTAWVYGARGKNFLLTILRLARERNELRVVADQFGAPTSSRFVAEATAQIIGQIPVGAAPALTLAHLTSGGITSWHGFASAIVEKGANAGLCGRPVVTAIGTSDYPVQASRPAFSPLDTRSIERGFGIRVPSWEHSLSAIVEELAHGRATPTGHLGTGQLNAMSDFNGAETVNF